MYAFSVYFSTKMSQSCCTMEEPLQWKQLQCNLDANGTANEGGKAKGLVGLKRKEKQSKILSKRTKTFLPISHSYYDVINKMVGII